MQRTKANLKALRERLGLSQGDVAGHLEVTRTSVKRWERPGFPDAPAELWDWLEGLLHSQRLIVDEVANRMMDAMDEGGEPDTVQLTIYRSQEQFDELGRDEGNFQVANANARAVWIELEGLGVPVEFAYPDDEANIYHQAR